MKDKIEYIVIGSVVTALVIMAFWPLVVRDFFDFVDWWAG